MTEIISPPTDRPNPLSEAASKVGVAWSAAGGVVSALVSFGVLTAAQGDAVTAVGAQAQDTVTAFGTVLGGILPLIAGVVAAFRTTSSARDHVTPVRDPRDDAGRPLVPAPAAPLVKPAGAPDKRLGDAGTVGDTWTS